MHKHKHSSRFVTAGLLVALAGLLPVASAHAAPAQQGNGPQSSSAITPRSHAPIVMNGWPLVTVFGIETVNYTAAQSTLVGSGATWIRRNALQWKDVEAVQGQRNWDAGLDADLVNASKNGQKVILIIHGTPVWARTIPSSTCSPIKSDQLGAFAAFVRDAVARYSQAPYNVKYWEVWNEPDAPATAGLNQPFGCWGNPSDPYFGGGDYANVLKAVSPQIRQADPSAKIVLGGLLLDCDPNKPASCGSPYLKMALYLEGILRNGGAPHFDIVSFHAYDFYGGNLGQFASNNWDSRWNTTGPVLIAKSRFIRSVLAQFGASDKQLMNTEVGLLCYLCGNNLSANFLTTKAYYVPQAYAAAIAESLSANVWYSYEGWEGSELTGQALDAFKVARAKLGGVTSAGDVAASDVGSSGVKGYKFTRNGKSIWVIWSLDGGTKNVTLSGTPAKITDPLGADQPAGASFQLTVKPLYVEFP
jgi:hypothetical protein